jgi:hypothetical protein
MPALAGGASGKAAFCEAWLVVSDQKQGDDHNGQSDADREEKLPRLPPAITAGGTALLDQRGFIFRRGREGAGQSATGLLCGKLQRLEIGSESAHG